MSDCVLSTPAVYAKATCHSALLVMSVMYAPQFVVKMSSTAVPPPAFAALLSIMLVARLHCVRGAITCSTCGPMRQLVSTCTFVGKRRRFSALASVEMWRMVVHLSSVQYPRLGQSS